MDCDRNLKRARDMNDLCDALSRKVVCVDDDESSEGSCESDDGDDPQDPWDAPYRPMRRYWEYEDSDSETDDALDPATPEVNASGEVPYVKIAPCLGADWCVDVTPPDVPDVRPDSKWLESYGEVSFDRFPDGMYCSRVLMTAAQVVECIENPDEHYGALAVMAEDYVRSLLRFEPDRVYASTVVRAFVDFAVRKLLDDPASSALLKVGEYDDARRPKMAVSYRSWRRLEMTYGFKP